MINFTNESWENPLHDIRRRALATRTGRGERFHVAASKMLVAKLTTPQNSWGTALGAPKSQIVCYAVGKRREPVPEAIFSGAIRGPPASCAATMNRSPPASSSRPQPASEYPLQRILPGLIGELIIKVVLWYVQVTRTVLFAQFRGIPPVYQSAGHRIADVRGWKLGKIAWPAGLSWPRE